MFMGSGVTQFNDNLWKPDIIERNTLTKKTGNVHCEWF